MNKLVSNDEAASSLRQIKQTQGIIKTKAVKEYLPWFGWGLFVLITYPPFDFIKPSIWGPITAILFIIGMILSFRYYVVSNKRIHAISHTPLSIAVLYFLFIFITILLANIFQSSFHYVWIIGGVILASLFFIYGFYLKSKA